MSLIHFFECRECQGKICRMQAESRGEEVAPTGACTVAYPPHGASIAIETRQQWWRLVETREVSE